MSNVSKPIKEGRAISRGEDRSSSSDLTAEQFQRVLPKKMRSNINPEMVDTINGLIQDPFIKETYRDNLLSYTSVMQDGRFKMWQYIDAVRYVSFKLLGASNIEAYTKTFPDRYQGFVDSQTTSKDIASYVSSYNKNKLVNLVMEQTLVPTCILNADMYQNALNVQADLMLNANSEKVRSDAANSLLTHLKMPETQKIELDITTKEDSAVSELREATLHLVAQQRRMIEANAMSAQEVAHSSLKLKVIEGEVLDK